MYNLAIVGATGAVGQEILRVLERRASSVKKLRCFASPRSVGKCVVFRGEEIPIEALSSQSFEEIDFALFSAGKKISLSHVPLAVQAGAVVIDNSSAFRLQKDVPLMIPEINPSVKHGGILACPNCTTAILCMALWPLYQKVKIKRIVVATYQAASGAGAIAMQELQQETLAVLENRPFERTVMPFPYAFNLFSHNSPMREDGYNEEEAKVIYETRKIFGDEALQIAVTSVRVPVLRVHSMALNVEFEGELSSEEAREILSASPGVRVLEDWKQNRFPMPLDATGRDEVFVGKIRKDLSQPCTLDFWVVGDQLLKGAALNAVQIMEYLYPT